MWTKCEQMELALMDNYIIMDELGQEPVSMLHDSMPRCLLGQRTSWWPAIDICIALLIKNIRGEKKVHISRRLRTFGFVHIITLFIISNFMSKYVFINPTTIIKSNIKKEPILILNRQELFNVQLYHC